MCKLQSDIQMQSTGGARRKVVVGGCAEIGKSSKAKKSRHAQSLMGDSAEGSMEYLVHRSKNCPFPSYRLFMLRSLFRTSSGHCIRLFLLGSSTSQKIRCSIASPRARRRRRLRRRFFLFSLFFPRPAGNRLVEESMLAITGESTVWIFVDPRILPVILDLPRI